MALFSVGISVCVCVCLLMFAMVGWLVSIQIAETMPAVHVSGSVILALMLSCMLLFFSSCFHPYAATPMPGNDSYTKAVL